MAGTKISFVSAILMCLASLASHAISPLDLKSLDAESLGHKARSYCAPRNFAENQDQCRTFIEQLKTTDFEPSRFKEVNLVLAEAYGDVAMSTADQRERAKARRLQYAIFEEILARSPDDIETLKLYAYAHEDENTSASILRKVLDTEPRDVMAHWILGLKLLDRGDEASLLEGLDHLHAAYTYAEGNWKLQMAADLYVRLGNGGFRDEAEDFKRQLHSDLQVGERISKAEEALELNQSVDEAALAVQDLTGTFCDRQYLLVEQNTCAHSLTLLDQLVKRAPKDAAMLALALDAHEQFIAGTYTLDEQSERSLYNRTEELLGVEPDQGDLPLLRKIVNDNPGASSAVRATLAEALLEAGQREEGIRQLRQAFDSSSNEQRHRYGKRLVGLLREAGRKNEADAITPEMDRP